MRVFYGIYIFSLISSVSGLKWPTPRFERLHTVEQKAQNRFQDFTAEWPIKKAVVATLSSFFLLSQGLQPTDASVLPTTLQVADSLTDANNKLSQYSLPPILFVPPGTSPLVSEIGRGNINQAMTNPIVVQFSYPSNWIVQKTSVNVNGEAGTIAANDYVKGDSSFLFLAPTSKTGALDPVQDKDLVYKFILSSLSQKGDPVDGLKVYQVVKGAAGVDGQTYLIADFSYQLNTEAGFLINRRAILSLTNVGDSQLQGLVSASTDKRWRNGMEPKLRAAAESFRVYKLDSGVFSSGGQTGANKPASPEN